MGANGNNNPDPNQNTDPTQSPGNTADTTGGGSDNSNAFAPWAAPNPQSTWGVASAVAYGENASCVIGPNTAVTFGNNASFCINPASLLAQSDASIPEIIKKAVGMGGVGGNLSFTLGANASVVLGPQYELLWGGKKSFHIGDARDVTVVGDKEQWEANTLCKKTNAVFGVVVGALVLTFFIAYGNTSDENSRLEWLLSLQSTLSIIVSVMLGINFVFDKTHTTLTDTLKELFLSPDPKPSTASTSKMVGKGVSSILAALVEPVILPSIVSASEENHWGSSIS